MNELIYYPSFEIYDNNWLKFALLYIDKLKPIIPYDGDRFVSDHTRHIYDSTDLFEIHRPEFEEGYNATLDAIEAIEKLLANPEYYNPIFHTSQIDEVLKSERLFNYTLFQDKYTKIFSNFVIENNLGIRTNEGLKISKQLGLLYMTILAQAISDTQGISPITNIKELDRFSIFTRHKNIISNNKITIAENTIKLKLPNNLSAINIEDIINLRNKKDFKTKLRAFHQGLDSYLSNENINHSEENFIESHKYIYDEFSSELLQLGFGLASFGIGVWMTTTSPETETAEIAQKLIEVGSFSLGGISISNSWQNTKPRRFCKKYLADLASLPINRE